MFDFRFTPTQLPGGRDLPSVLPTQRKRERSPPAMAKMDAAWYPSFSPKLAVDLAEEEPDAVNRTQLTHVVAPRLGPGFGEPVPPRFVAGLQDRLSTIEDHHTGDGRWRPKMAHLLGRHGAGTYSTRDTAALSDTVKTLASYCTQTGARAFLAPSDALKYELNDSGFGLADSLKLTNPHARATWLRSRSVHPGFSFGGEPTKPVIEWRRQADAFSHRPAWVQRMGLRSSERGLTPLLDKQKRAYPPNSQVMHPRYTTALGSSLSAPQFGAGFRCTSPPRFPPQRDAAYGAVPRRSARRR